MLTPITKKMTDFSTGEVFHFTFYCDLCGKPWHCEPVRSQNGRPGGPVWQRDHDSAYERANQEAMRHFNRCPVCKRWVCDDCFLILPVRDVCKECAKQESKEEGG